MSLRSRNIRTMASLAALAAALAPAAHAATIFYSDAGAFSAAEPGLAPVSFSGLGASQPYIHPNGLVFPGVTISTVAPGMQSSALVVFKNSVGNNWFGDTVVLSFAPDVNAVGADIFNQVGEPGSVIVSAPITEDVYSGATLLGERMVTEGSGFFGVSSTSAITKVTFFSDCDVDCSTFVNDISLSSASPTPEPAGWALMLAGFGLVGAAARRRREKQWGSVPEA